MATQVVVDAPWRVRELEPDEWDRLRGIPPFDRVGPMDAAGRAGHVRMVVAETPDGKIVGYWMLFDAVHAEPMWIAEEFRHNPALIRRLWGKTRELLQEAGIPVAFAFIAEGALPTNLPQALRLGFQPLKGELFYLFVDQSKDLGGKERG
jgi:hypothetical protein